MPQLHTTEVDLEYHVTPPRGEKRGDVLLIHGLGCQFIQWPDALVDMLAAGGYQVVRFDNRDVGLSRLHDAPRPYKYGALDLLRWRLGKSLPSAYTLVDMATDAVALLDHLQIERAHVVGASMGGMITQELAMHYPQRIASQTLIMTTSGRRSVGQARASVLKSLFKPPAGRDRASLVKHLVKQWSLLQGAGYPTDEAELTRQVEACVDRGLNGPGFLRQSQAVMNAPNREPRLKKLNLPTLVIHGSDDPLVNVSGGRALARAIPLARLEVIKGWGHDFPPTLNPRLAALILDHISAGAV